jgi:hypothetical protein
MFNNNIVGDLGQGFTVNQWSTKKLNCLSTLDSISRVLEEQLWKPKLTGLVI